MVRIKGLVRTFQVVRTQLQQGIPEDRVAEFRRSVRDAIDTVEAICAKQGASPSELPPQSRQAYDFLKNLDLDNLPLIHNTALPSQGKSRPIQIKNVINTCDGFIHRLSEQAFELEKSAETRRKMAHQIQGVVDKIEAICKNAGTSPSMLETPSRNAYCFMKFLVTNDNLERHVQTLCKAIRLASSLRPAQEKRKMIVQFAPMRKIYTSEPYRNAMLITLNEGWIDADDQVLSAIFRSVFQGKSQTDRRVISDYVASEGFCAVLYDLDAMAGVIECDAKGRVFDLDDVFEKVNREYFGGKMEKPLCHWNRTLTLAKFGHYQPSRDRVMISVTLDDENVPAFVVEFVMYHELLHKKHGAAWSNGKRYVHTPAFREEEKKFKYFHEAEVSLKQLAKKQRAT